MVSLLFVDDDRDILEGLKSTIKWSLIGVKIVGTVGNGIEALEFLEENPSLDIIVTDVRMPGMDGIELSKNVSENYPQTKLIILSGYSEFKYAKSAMEYGVSSYLLKPVMIKELLETVYKISKEIIKKQEEQEKNKEKFLLEAMIKNLDSKESLIEGFKNQGIKKYISPYFLINIQFSLWESSLKIMKELEDEFKIKAEQFFLLQRYPSEYYFIIAASIEEKDIILILTNWKEILLEQKSIEVKIAMSQKFETLTDLNKAYEQVNIALKSSFFYEDKEIYFYNEEEESVRTKESKDPLKAVNSLIYKGEGTIDIDSLDQIFNSLIKQGLYDEEVFKDVSVNILNRILKVSIQKNEYIYSAVYEEHLKVKESIKCCRKFSQLHEIMIDFFIFVGQIDKNNKLDSKSRITNEMKEFINNNYFKDLDINQLSSMFNRSPNYLSHLFSEICGETFSKYLNKVRIERSKELLKKPDYTLYCIAKDIGYSDQRYFIKMFKKNTGLTPTEFRNTRDNNI